MVTIKLFSIAIRLCAANCQFRGTINWNRWFGMPAFNPFFATTTQIWWQLLPYLNSRDIEENNLSSMKTETEYHHRGRDFFRKFIFSKATYCSTLMYLEHESEGRSWNDLLMNFVHPGNSTLSHFIAPLSMSSSGWWWKGKTEKTQTKIVRSEFSA